MKHYIGLILVFALAACQSSSTERLRVEGHFTNAAGKKIMLAELPFGRPERMVIDSATLDSSGVFKLNAIQQQEGMYQLFVQGGPGILLINDTNQIVVNADAEKLQDYTVTVSKASKSIKSLYEKLTELEQKAGKLKASADSIAKTKTPDSLAAPFYAARDRSAKEISHFLNAYLGMEKNATALWYGLGVSAHFLTKEDWAAQMKKAASAYPHHPGLSMMKVSLAAAEEQESAGKHLLNKPVPNIAMPDTSGTMVSVSQFRGKWLLIDFWASWCAPCRQENPGIVAAYKQFRNKNFTILGISLDEKKEAWTKAIRNDSLPWAQISDLKFWDSKAAEIYGFKALPFNILVDTGGTVVAVNLYGQTLTDSLENKLKNRPR